MRQPAQPDNLDRHGCTLTDMIKTLIIGLLAGGFGGLIGLGGGVVMVPLMVGFLKTTQHQAHGTSLVALVFTGISGAITYAINGSVDYVAAITLAVTAVLTARSGAQFAHALPEWKLKRSFGGFLLFVSILLMLKPYLSSFSSTAEGTVKLVILLIIGGVAGFFSGMMGIGGGSVMVPAMVLLIGLTQHTAQGSSLLCMVPAGAVGAYTHWKLGNVIKAFLPGLIPGVFIGTYFGGSLAHLLQEGTLRLIFSAFIAWTGIRYLTTKKPQESL